jgi:hypothetical protein
MRKITEWIMSLFFSKEAIELVRREAAQEVKSELTRYENKKFLTVKKRYTKV